MTNECLVALIQKMDVERQELSKSTHITIVYEGGLQGL